MATQRKIDAVNELTDKLSRAKSVVVADYRGLKHKQLEELRKLLKKSEGEFVVAKNRLLLRALGDQSAKLKSSLEDTSAILFAYADEVAPLKELMKFFKTTGMGKAKAGLLGAQALTEDEVARLSKLPDRLTILTHLAGQLNSPIQGLHYALKWNINKLAYALNAIQGTKKN